MPEPLLDEIERIGREILRNLEGKTESSIPRQYYQVCKILLEVFEVRFKRGEVSEKEVAEKIRRKLRR